MKISFELETPLVRCEALLAGWSHLSLSVLMNFHTCYEKQSIVKGALGLMRPLTPTGSYALLCATCSLSHRLHSINEWLRSARPTSQARDLRLHESAHNAVRGKLSCVASLKMNGSPPQMAQKTQNDWQWQIKLRRARARRNNKNAADAEQPPARFA